MSDDCRHYLIRGRVQGVSYRFTAQQVAQDLNLAGWVRNLQDGRVEALAAGERSALNVFERWLRKGPPGAAVSEVSIRSIDPDSLDGSLPPAFEIHRTA